ncbi:class I SAM-dependent methyltransferase [Amycolatopsis sp. NPDC059027]|uniref:class I SAM-dependent methyltransferase n=1 Tax=unclassified Amycolatopsis TaxID=2618356 RepID=UPI00366FF7E8
MTITDSLAAALAAYRAADLTAASAHVEAAAEAGSLLAAELRTYLGGETAGPVYEQPRAFTTFIRGGGNVELYRRLSAELAARYDAQQPKALLDLGCGDGLAVVPALAQARHSPMRVDLVEPSGALLEAARRRLVREVHTWEATAQSFLGHENPRWDLTQSTFALQSIPPAERAGVLRVLRPRTAKLVIAEFDVPEYVEGSPEHLRSLVTRYERGVAEYGTDASLVAQGFLLPVLLGLVTAKERTNWEHPAATWVTQLTEAGYTDVEVEPLADYWWSPAVLVTATGRG